MADFGFATSAAPTYADKSFADLSLDLSGNLRTTGIVQGGGSAGTPSGGVVTVQGVSNGTPVIVTPKTNSGIGSGLVTYRAVGEAYGAYATPTDLITIYGSNTKTVVITAFFMTVQTTVAAIQSLYFIKRSATNTGGTAAAQSAIALDSTFPAATAAVNLYSVIPSSLGAGNIVAISKLLSGAATASPATFTPASFFAFPNANTFQSGVTLRGASEGFVINYNGAALTAGFSAGWGVEWQEF